MNKLKELEQAIELEWMENNAPDFISIRSMVDLLNTGIDQCHIEDWCAFREYAPNGYCRCTRDALPSMDAVELYERLNTLTLRVELAKHLGRLAKLPTD